MKRWIVSHFVQKWEKGTLTMWNNVTHEPVPSSPHHCEWPRPLSNIIVKVSQNEIHRKPSNGIAHFSSIYLEFCRLLYFFHIANLRQTSLIWCCDNTIFSSIRISLDQIFLGSFHVDQTYWIRSRIASYGVPLLFLHPRSRKSLELFSFEQRLLCLGSGTWKSNRR